MWDTLLTWALTQMYALEYMKLKNEVEYIPRDTKDLRWGCDTPRLLAYTNGRNKLVVAISGQMVGAPSPPLDIPTHVHISKGYDFLHPYPPTKEFVVQFFCL